MVNCYLKGETCLDGPLQFCWPWPSALSPMQVGDGPGTRLWKIVSKILEQALKKQEETIKEQQKLIKELKTEVGQVKPPEKQVVAQPKPAPPVAGVQPGKPATLAVKEAPVPAPAEGTQTAALQEEVEDLREQVGQVAEAQKQDFSASSIPPSGSWVRRSSTFAVRRPSIRSPSREPIPGLAASMSSNAPWNWILPGR